jgi:ketosteroid isomerase-like protein
MVGVSTLEVVERFNEVFNTGDADAIMALMTPDVVFESTSPAPDGRRFEGGDAVRKVWLRLFEKTSSPHFDWEEVAACGDRATVRWSYSWANDDGSRSHVRGVDLIRVRDGKVAEKLSYVKG